MKNVGFFYISGYDDGDELKERVFETGKKIFELPAEVKNDIGIKKSRVFRGYVQKGELT